MVVFKGGKWFCSACGARLEGMFWGVPRVETTTTADHTVTVITSDDGAELHRCETRREPDT